MPLRAGALATLCLLLLGCLTLGLPTFAPPSLRLVYNASDSAPRGFYAVRPAVQLKVGDFVVTRLPAAVATFAATRGYLPRTIPILKRIAAAAGDVVCVRAGVVAIDRIVVARTRLVDGQGRALPGWNHCRQLVDNELFLLNTAPDSFDSRYFGPVDASFVRGKATPLFIVPAKSGCCVR
jgi:conjugative transfer signal peptidase TraF